MLVLSYLLRTGVAWQGATVFVKLVVGTATTAAAARHNLEDVVARLRIGARVDVLVSEGRPFEQILRESSTDADLVLLGVAAPDDDVRYYQRLQERTAGLPATVFVLAAPDLPFGDVLP